MPRGSPLVLVDKSYEIMKHQIDHDDAMMHIDTTYARVIQGLPGWWASRFRGMHLSYYIYFEESSNRPG